MIISNSRQFIFVHLHKTAGETVTANLEPFLNESDLVLTNTFRDLSQSERERFSRFCQLDKHSPVTKIMDCLSQDEWDSYFSFSFVRHPIDRVISLYNFTARIEENRSKPYLYNLRFLVPAWKHEDPRLWPAVVAFRESNTFSEFIRHPELAKDRAMVSQFDSLVDSSGKIAVNYVAHFERFEDELTEIQSRLAIPNHLAAVKNRAGVSLMDRKQLTSSDRDLLVGLFEKDFQAFGFELS